MGASKHNPNSILKKQGRQSEIKDPKRKNVSAKEREKMITEIIMKSDVGKIFSSLKGGY